MTESTRRYILKDPVHVSEQVTQSTRMLLSQTEVVLAKDYDALNTSLGAALLRERSLLELQAPLYSRQRMQERIKELENKLVEARDCHMKMVSHYENQLREERLCTDAIKEYRDSLQMLERENRREIARLENHAKELDLHITARDGTIQILRDQLTAAKAQKTDTHAIQRISFLEGELRDLRHVRDNMHELIYGANGFDAKLRREQYEFKKLAEDREKLTVLHQNAVTERNRLHCIVSKIRDAL